MNLNPLSSAGVGRIDAIFRMGGRIRTGLTCGFTGGPLAPRCLVAPTLPCFMETTPPVLPKPSAPRPVS
eukprot:11508677-Karenia_brevis.AAC.1